eukprot:CAMPEP_0172577640 /NCGR_PEP_ID=MMETSP1067-20121228/138333_1 /TAXON_ID=265564 ORGANISM="Thalassiosira punctigera, Strain Tpunct2005C2" /NCGR_SAMPLE_ID=MMETSP1067 /ASSEMBLY_ACC=CAM_ASM_000444 /LENGTH=957 /DNA_ID=CAMNT_0013370329 /DNA_START=1 /DNA_END=2874 /DNA_ORIENTATION=+
MNWPLPRGGKGSIANIRQSNGRGVRHEENHSSSSDGREERGGRETTATTSRQPQPQHQTRGDQWQSGMLQWESEGRDGAGEAPVRSAKFVPLSLVMNRRDAAAGMETAPPDRHDPSSENDDANDLVRHSRTFNGSIQKEDFPRGGHQVPNRDRRRQHEQQFDDDDDRDHDYNTYSSESSDPHSRNRNRRERRRDPISCEAGEDVEAERRRRQRNATQSMQQQQRSQEDRNDHSFTQFNIQPLPQPLERDVKRDDDDDEYSADSESDEENEEIPLFFPPSEFNSATDKFSDQHIKGAECGVDYIEPRARRKEEERQKKKEKQQFEIEQRRKRRRREEKSGWLSWWWWIFDYDDDDDAWDDVDFDNYHNSTFRFQRGRARFVLVFSLTFLAAIAFLERDNLLGRSKGRRRSNRVHGRNSNQTSAHHGSIPSSRWGNRFDDAAATAGDDMVILAPSAVDNDGRDGEVKRAPRYHHRGHNRTRLPSTPEQKNMELEKWEDYEMEVASVLAGSGTGRDIHSKNGELPVEDGDNSTDGSDEDDRYTDHWVRYHDKSSGNYYYFHRETNMTQWEAPLMNEGVVLLGVVYGTGSEYVIEEGGSAVVESNNENNAQSSDGESSGMEEENPVEEEDPASEADFDAQQVLAQYKDSYWRWNHPYRIPERKEVWGGIDAPVFWRIPLSGATTLEEIVTHCYNMTVAGTTGSTKDGKAVLSRNISKHLSVLTLDDGAHYLNIDMGSKEGIQKARTAGLGRSGVADVILTRYLYNAADLFQNTGHTGRCFAMLRHPVERAIAQFRSLKRNGVKAVSNMDIEQYSKSSIAEGNWMIRMITNTMEGKITRKHYDVAAEVFGSKCLVGLLDKYSESMEHFAKFFRWEEIKSINTRHPHAASDAKEREKDLEGKRKCFRSMVKKGVNRHQYAPVRKDSSVWKDLREKNFFDIKLYEYAKEMYLKQQVVYEENGVV